MGGSSKSSSSDTTYYDQRVAASDGSVVAAQGGTVNMLDGGVVREAFDFGTVALKQVGQAVETSNDTIFGVVKQALSQNQQALNTVADSNQQMFDSLANNSQRALETVVRSQQSEQAQTMDKLLSTTALIGLLYFGYRVLK